MNWAARAPGDPAGSPELLPYVYGATRGTPSRARPDRVLAAAPEGIIARFERELAAMRGPWAGAGREPRPGTLPARVLQVLAGLGGEATTPEVSRALEESGDAPASPRYTVTVLARLADSDPPAVTRAGVRDRGRAGVQRWRLAVSAVTR